MQAFQQRVIDEKKELDEKRVKLAAFLQGETFKTLPTDEQHRLQVQALSMSEYSTILGERIKHFA